MFCFGGYISDYCKSNCRSCEDVKLLDNLELEFKNFTSEDDIEMCRELLCLVSSYEEEPYFIVIVRYERGICNAFDGKLLENTEILKWAYLPAVKL